ncbi:ATP-binding cassette domain-containing protein [Levilactobacillus fujinensis]|uniref:ATP-binding cassette domain-containing protein n=1 Tax=Levilactobacillus fujinensis TaxID=2486024 RepID=A0ABW1TCQ7_9LACO|nr:ATP-binding cassette domain-containing protein [Levilactobacillus fujinensis]
MRATLSYNQYTTVRNNFTCTIPTGELVALLGPSDSGKSTILNLLAGLLTSDTGQILFNQLM